MRKKVLKTEESAVITYDTTKDENSVFGLSMGCRGIVRILLESIKSNDLIIHYLTDLTNERMPCVVATLIDNNKNENIGKRLFFDETGIHQSDFEDNEILDLLPYVRRAFTDNFTGITELNFGQVFIETITPPIKLLLFGAGYDALPLINFAKEIGWNVTVIDHRAAFANAERLPEADEIIVSGSEDVHNEIFEDENSVAVIMTHNYERDREILRRLLYSKCLYIGALGPKNRAEKLLEEIGEDFTNEQLEKLHAPVGLDIGADTPETIALSIVAEINGVLAGRNGGFLRNRKGSIYGRD